MSGRMDAILAISSVIPVVTLARVSDAVPLARALRSGGIGIIEVTLRSEAAWDGIRAIIAELPDMVVGAGTCLCPAQLESAREAGCAFAVSPGATPALLKGSRESGLPLLAGAATLSEMMSLQEQGHTHLKLFPAEPSGGCALLKSIAPVLPDLRFCPTGGITVDNAPSYLALPNVVCVGGTWITPATLIADANWTRVTALADAAARLRPI